MLTASYHNDPVIQQPRYRIRQAQLDEPNLIRDGTLPSPTSDPLMRPDCLLSAGDADERMKNSALDATQPLSAWTPGFRLVQGHSCVTRHKGWCHCAQGSSMDPSSSPGTASGGPTITLLDLSNFW